jgi:hypothetical protein
MDDDYMIPDERDQIEAPKRPDLRCAEHGVHCRLIHSLLDRVAVLEEEVRGIREAGQ